MSDDADQIAALLAKTEPVRLEQFVTPCEECEWAWLARGKGSDVAFGWYTPEGLAKHKREYHPEACP